MKSVTILGATGSIGDSAFEVVTKNPDAFQIVGVAGGANVDKLAKRAIAFSAKYAVIADETKYEALKSALQGTNIVPSAGKDAILDVASVPVDICLSAIIGAAGIAPTLAAAKSAKRVALANKETLVAAGKLMLATVKAHRTELIPVDSEHSGIFQAVAGQDQSSIKSVIVTASGGAFRDWSYDEMRRATPEDALKHPTYSMGTRITIDSASMFNKVLELIEAQVLFDLKPDQVKTVIHPGSIVHALVAYRDGGMLAHMGHPDMRHAISYGLTYPARLENSIAELDLVELGQLAFKKMDTEKFPAVKLGYWAMEKGGLAGAALNAAKESALDHFIARKIRFTDMADCVEHTLTKLDGLKVLDDDAENLDAIMNVDKLAREIVTRGIPHE